MKSGLYTGWVRHRRFAPIVHRFRYRALALALDLDELHMIRFWPLLAVDRAALMSVRQSDYLDGELTRERVWDVQWPHIAELPQTLALHHGSLEYLQEFRRDAGALHIKRRMTMRPTTVAPAALPAWSKMLERLERAETQSLEFAAPK